MSQRSFPFSTELKEWFITEKVQLQHVTVYLSPMEARGYDSVFKAELKFGLYSPFSSSGASSF